MNDNDIDNTDPSDDQIVVTDEPETTPDEEIGVLFENINEVVAEWANLPIDESRNDAIPALMGKFADVGRCAKSLADSGRLTAKQKRGVKSRNRVNSACLAELKASFTFD